MSATKESSARYLDPSATEHARERGVDFEPKPVDRIVITGYASVTPFGNTENTWVRLLQGDSSVRNVEFGNPDIRIASLLPEDYDPIRELLPTDKKRGQSMFSASCIKLARESLGMAGLLSDQGKIDETLIDPRQVAGWIGSGYAASDMMIDVHDNILAQQWRKISPDLSLQMFPEQGNGRTAGSLGYRGPGGNTMEACATGASNIVNAYDILRQGKATVAVAGGIETVPMTHIGEAVAAFNGLKALSRRNDDPEGASRPFDRDRDGFVAGAGGSIIVMESLEHALERGATIYGEMLGAEKSMDGSEKPTEMDSQRVAETIEKTIYDRNTRNLRVPDAIFAHATSTAIGDHNEAEALRQVFGSVLEDIPVTALKSQIGHLLGGAGAVNIVSALQALRDQTMPYIRNLENPDPKIADKGLLFVRNSTYEAPPDKPIDTVLATAYGFGGYNAIVFLGTYQEKHMASF